MSTTLTSATLQGNLTHLTVNTMSIKGISDSIKNLFTKVRNPVKILSSALVLCSALKRPGLSTILSVANIVKDLNKFGIPTGPMPDGTPNLTVAMVYAVVNEVQRSIKEDMVIQIVMNPGSISFVGSGANAGGPVTVTGVNVNSGIGVGITAAQGGGAGDNNGLCL